MRRCRTALLFCFVSLACLAATPTLAGEIVDEPAQEMIEGLLEDLAQLRTPGRGASGTLRTLLSSSDSAICGFWQMKQHALGRRQERTMRGSEDRTTPEMQQTEVAPLVIEAGARM